MLKVHHITWVAFENFDLLIPIQEAEVRADFLPFGEPSRYLLWMAAPTVSCFILYLPCCGRNPFLCASVSSLLHASIRNGQADRMHKARVQQLVVLPELKKCVGRGLRQTASPWIYEQSKKNPSYQVDG